MMRMWLAVGALVVVPAIGAAQDDFRWDGQIARGDAIEIKGINGDISAEFTDGDRVEVTAVKRARRDDPDEVEIEVVEHDGGVTICAVYPSRRRSRPNECAPGRAGRMNVRDNDTRVHFRVLVPAGVGFIGKTVNGDVEAFDLQGDVRVNTVNGDLEVTTTGSAEGHTVNGSIDVEFGALDGDARFETVNGSVTLTLPEASDADVEIRTVNGAIESDLPILMTGRFSRRRLDGQLGRGGPLLAIETVNGSIRIRGR